MTEPILCDRCGAVANVQWFDVTRLGDRDRSVLPGRSECPTPGCVDWTGSSSVPMPEQRTGLTAEDHRWLGEQRQLADEYARVARVLAAAGMEEW
jgi:hypothetical protein